MASSDHASLYILGDHGQTVDESANDVRGRKVIDTNGDGIGKVADLLVDDIERKVRFLVVEHGGFLGFGETKSLIPVDVITKITADEVTINQARERVASAPGYAPHLVDDRPFHSSVYSHYGYKPYWATGYGYPLGGGTYPMGLGLLPASSPLGLN